jgi:hypothetical protein
VYFENASPPVGTPAIPTTGEFDHGFGFFPIYAAGGRNFAPTHKISPRDWETFPVADGPTMMHITVSLTGFSLQSTAEAEDASARLERLVEGSAVDTP